MEIENTIKHFLEFAQNEESPLEDLGELITILDSLAHLANSINFEFDETEYPEAPDTDFKLVREKVEKRFPNLGFYNTPVEVSDKISETELSVGDAIEDITDIVGDLLEVIWYFENTSRNDALWHFQVSFRSHWGRHLRELQLYLHDKWW
ncbi:MAG: DUF5063 domain-containing protein [Proteobacteria bacterium]|nr:DUF5063 domain-containing protein [Pseudomonadota bacterium]